jgi:restriction system protein
MAAAEHNAAVDQFEREFRAIEPEAVAEFLTPVLDRSVYPDGFPHSTRAFYRPAPRETVVEYELPPQSVIPVQRAYKYVQNQDEIDTLPARQKRSRTGMRA